MRSVVLANSAYHSDCTCCAAQEQSSAAAGVEFGGGHDRRAPRIVLTIAARTGSLRPMSTRVNRQTVDLSKFPDLVVIYLGMRVNRITGIKTLLGFGPRISASVAAQAEGLLRH